MRLTSEEQVAIKKIVMLYDPESEIYLFGSRVNESLRGGDIDLLVISEKLEFRDKLNILADLHEQLGDQKIDVLLDKDGNGSFARTVMPSAKKL